MTGNCSCLLMCMWSTIHKTRRCGVGTYPGRQCCVGNLLRTARCHTGGHPPAACRAAWRTARSPAVPALCSHEDLIQSPRGSDWWRQNMCRDTRLQCVRQFSGQHIPQQRQLGGHGRDGGVLDLLVLVARRQPPQNCVVQRPRQLLQGNLSNDYSVHRNASYQTALRVVRLARRHNWQGVPELYSQAEAAAHLDRWRHRLLWRGPHRADQLLCHT